MKFTREFVRIVYDVVAEYASKGYTHTEMYNIAKARAEGDNIKVEVE